VYKLMPFEFWKFNYMIADYNNLKVRKIFERV